MLKAVRMVRQKGVCDFLYNVLIWHHIFAGICEKGGLTYENGEKLESGCDSVCTCMNGKMDCTERCTGSFFKKGKRIEDPLCTSKDSDDPCCSILVCTADTGKFT